MRDDILRDLLDQPAWMVKERYGLKQDVRTLQRWARREHGAIPTRQQRGANPDRQGAVSRMIRDGLHEHYCSVEHHGSFWPCLIRDTADGSIFVCRKHARRGDY